MTLFGEVMEPIGRRDLLEKIDHWRQALGVHGLNRLPVHSLCFVFAVEYVISCSDVLLPYLHHIMDFTYETISPNKLSQFPWSLTLP